MTKEEKQLQQIIPHFFEEKKIGEEHAKAAGVMNIEIKELMSKAGLSEFEMEGFKALYSTRVSESFNETLLIDLIKKLMLEKGIKVRGIIKKKEYVDMDVLESALYNNMIDAALLEPAQIRNETNSLRVMAVKPKKEKS